MALRDFKNNLDDEALGRALKYQFNIWFGSDRQAAIAEEKFVEDV